MARPQNPKNDLQLGAQNALSKLFGVSAGEVAATGFKLLAPSQIETGPQPRTVFEQKEIQELAQSIAGLRDAGGGIEKTGILQPLLVRALAGNASNSANGAQYRLISGERRLRAAQTLGISHVPVIVQDGAQIHEENGTLWAAQIVENLQRRDLPPLDEAHALSHLLDQRKLSIREAAALLGKPKSYLSDRLALLKMGEDVQQMLSDRSDTLLHARLIDAIANAALRQQLIELTLAGAGRREIERIIEAQRSESQNAPQSQNGEEGVSDRSDTREKWQNATENRFGTGESENAGETLNQLETLARQWESICAAPCLTQRNRWSEQEKKRLQRAVTRVQKQLDLLKTARSGD